MILVFGFWDQNDRYWSTPIEWQNYQRRVLMPYPAGFEYSSYRSKSYGGPKTEELIKAPRNTK